MNKKLIAIGTTTLFVILLFTPQAIAIDEEEPTPLPTQTYLMANITGIIELQDSSYPFFNLLNQLIGFKNGVLWLVEAKMTEGTIEAKFDLLKLGLRDITVPSEEYSYADLTIFRFQGTLEQIGETNTYNIQGNVTWLVVNLVE